MARWVFLFLASLTPFAAYTQQFVPSQPLYHANGVFASSGLPDSTFYHENGRIAWNGMNHIDPQVFHQSGAVAWAGYFSKECIISYSSSTIYHSNGEKAWKGASYKETTFTTEPSSVFHNNGTLAWKGALYQDCQLPYNDCAVFYRNGNIAWKGATPKQSFYNYETAKVLHSNGKKAWLGSFAFEASSVVACGVFHDNGNLAWSGRKGDPIYDRYGRITTEAAEEINMPLGENSKLYLSSKGIREVHIAIGDESFLIFSNQEESPRLQIQLGMGYTLQCFPYTGQMPQITVYGTPIPVRTN